MMLRKQSEAEVLLLRLLRPLLMSLVMLMTLLMTLMMLSDSFIFGGLVRFICSFRSFACSDRRDRDDGYLARCVRRTGDLSCWPLCPLALPAAQAGHDVEQTWLIQEETRAGISF